MEQKCQHIITVRGRGSVKPYLIIKGVFSQSLRAPTEGAGGSQKFKILRYVIYEQPRIKKDILRDK